MKIEKYVVELINGSFGTFNQESNTDILILSSELHQADFLDKEQALKCFKDLSKDEVYWNYYGKCTKAKGIRKVLIELV